MVMTRVSWGGDSGTRPIPGHSWLSQWAIRLLGVWIGTAVLGLACCEDCRAELLIAPENVVAAPGTSGFFDVLLSNTNPAGGASFDVAGDTVELSVTGVSGVSFTSVSISTIVPYIYANSGTLNGGGPFSFDTFPNTQVHASDTEFAAPGSRTVLPGATFGLAHVGYSVASNAAIGSIGSLAIGPDTSLSDINGAAIGFSASNGSFSILSPAVPEPSSVLLLAGGAFGMLYVFRRR